MQSLMTLLGGASLGAGAMYLMDPDRGPRRRAELRDTLAEVADSELVERARQLEPMAAARQLGGGVGALLEASRWVPAARSRWVSAARLRGGRRRVSALEARDWALLGGFVGAVAAGLWLARRALDTEGIRIVRTMTVEAPIERVYEFWSDFENFPRFMSHVREVKRTGPDRTHWVVAGPGGTPIEWDAVITDRVPNEMISWRTVEGSLVEHRGTVRFRPAGTGATRVEVRMTYRPVGGALGHGIAELFGSDPERVIGEDLARVATHLRGTRPAVGETGQRR
jgi:uncharacterized membrane protein